MLEGFNDLKRPLLGPNVKLLKLWGLLLPTNGHKRRFYLLMHTLMAIFVISEWVECYTVRNDFNQVLYNLKTTMLGTISLYKVVTFLYWQKNWKGVIDYATKADAARRNTDDPKILRIIANYTKNNRRVTIFYACLMIGTAVVAVIQPFVKYFSSSIYRDNVKNGIENYVEITSSWVPCNKNKMPCYLAAVCYQAYVAVYGGGWITSYDTNAFALLTYIRAELELIRMDCVDIFGTVEKPVSDAIALERLKACHKKYSKLIK
jgi:hypothetical protein